MAAALGWANACEVFSLPFPPPRGVCRNSDCVTREVLEPCAARDAGRQEGAEGLPCDALYLGRDACKDPVLLQQLVGLLGESIELTPDERCV
ncbi:hypothetical protein TcBrA4_0138700 [Trypanosoma cruzi]|nr:hypothetical protein TcBrA4_0138700 [Trypanosoma cruzi]